MSHPDDGVTVTEMRLRWVSRQWWLCYGSFSGLSRVTTWSDLMQFASTYYSGQRLGSTVKVNNGQLRVKPGQHSQHGQHGSTEQISVRVKHSRRECW
ncbi:hypothetical protein Hanom_Chr09g00821251 [Helianthus anomalus]